MNMNTRKAQGGFTLIELVIVIVLLGLLAAVAIPRFVDLQDDALAASCDGVRGALFSTAAILYAENRGEPASASDIVAGTIAEGWSVDGTPSCGSIQVDIDETACVNPIAIPADLCED
jgi:MSHA pilin protein MshA